MGKAKAKAQARAAARVAADSADSLDSESTSASTWRDDVDEREEDEFQSQLDALFEKRATTRESALAALVALLRRGVQQEGCEAHDATLTARCIASLRKGGAAEASLAATTLGLHVLTLGEQNEARFRELQRDLLRTAQQGLPAATDALALCAFVCAEHRGTTLDAMTAIRALWKIGEPAARAAAVAAWAFLAASVSCALPAAEVESVLVQLSGLLSEGSVELRVAAGEAVALLYSSIDLAHLAEEAEGLESLEEEDWFDEEEAPDTLVDAAVNGVSMPPRLAPAAANGNGVHAGAAAPPGGEAAIDGAVGVEGATASGASGTSAGTAAAYSTGLASAASDGSFALAASNVSVAASSGLDDVVDRMKDLAMNKGDATRRSKRDRAALRGTFRRLLAVVDAAGSPKAKIKLQHGDVLTVESMEGLVQLNFFRKVLAGGFQAHVQSNELLHAVFDYNPATAPPEKLTALEKRLYRSPQSVSSKARAQGRSSQRSHKTMLHGGGDY